MIWSSLPWWDTLHAWWSEHPKYAFQMVTNSMSSVDQMVSNFDQATSTPPISDTQALDENTPKMTGPAQLPSIQESCNLSLLSPLESPIPSLLFIGAQHSLVNSYPQSNLALNSLLIMDPSLPPMNSMLPSFDPPLPPTSSIDLSPLHSDVPFPDIKIKSDMDDMPALTLSSGPSARSTPGPKSIGKSSSQLSSCSLGPKGWRDFMADFHEASQIDQEQAQQEANHHHMQQMLHLEIKKEKMCHRYELESLKLQVQLAQAQLQPHQLQPLPLLHIPKDQVYLP